VADHALFIGFGSPRAGRERLAAQNFEDSVAYTEQLKAAGEIESAEIVTLTAHGGDLNGFFLLRGDPEKLARLTMAPEFRRLALRAGIASEHVGFVNALVDGEALRSLAAWKEAVADLT
jgi:hypothetical protein